MTAADNALAFAAVTALEEGRLDDHLFPIYRAVQQRRELYDQKQQPRRRLDMSDHQVWAWMNYTDRRPRWEVRGTGLTVDPETEELWRVRRQRLAEGWCDHGAGSWHRPKVDRDCPPVLVAAWDATEKAIAEGIDPAGSDLTWLDKPEPVPDPRED